MKKETGQKSFDIWILGDSNPKNWEYHLDYPFDSRHPIRHNIITSVFDIIQEYVYLNSQLRIATRKIYTRNAIEDSSFKPDKYLVEWSDVLNIEIRNLKNDLNNYKPKLFLTFGAFSFEFARRCLQEPDIKNYTFWNTKRLGEEFFKRVSNFYCEKINLIPMLHRSIAGGKFLRSHDLFCQKTNANYFEETGYSLGLKVLENKKSLNIWCTVNS